ncbi:unnamed protein product [Ceutorhynchus assimilis]|uniref:Protein rolling stone n=1 Tax=Ceutorhynchus assimilis TaxID=467358 RepID=A0A9N9QIW6_9CUCU|nr:unnamed protein product [Ceutorhynchus assimilis]
MLGLFWKKHLSLQQFKALHQNPTTFIVSQWQHDKSAPNFKYSIYRWSIFLIFFVSWIFTYTKETTEGRPRWPIYLTNWGFTLCMLQSLLCTIMLSGSLIGHRYSLKSQLEQKVLKMYSVYWVLNTIATPLAFTISIIYWTLIYGAEGATFSAMNFIVHGLNSILMFVDLWIVCHPVQILHFIYPLLLAFAYTIFTIIFYVAGGTTKTGSRYIYPILKWDEPGKTAGVCAGVMILMIFLHLFLFLIFKARTKLYNVLYISPIELPVPAGEQSAYDNKAMATEYV